MGIFDKYRKQSQDQGSQALSTTPQKEVEPLNKDAIKLAATLESAGIPQETYRKRLESLSSVQPFEAIGSKKDIGMQLLPLRRTFETASTMISAPGQYAAVEDFFKDQENKIRNVARPQGVDVREFQLAQNKALALLNDKRIESLDNLNKGILKPEDIRKTAADLVNVGVWMTGAAAPAFTGLKGAKQIAALSGTEALLGGTEAALSGMAERGEVDKGDVALQAGVGAVFPVLGVGAGKIAQAVDMVRKGDKAAASLIVNKVNRANPKQLEDFAKRAKQTHGEYLVDRGIIDTRENTIIKLVERVQESKRKVDESLGMIQGRFQSRPIKEVLDESLAHAKKVRNKTKVKQFKMLKKKYDQGGIDMPEIQSVKRYFQANKKMGYLKDATISSDEVQRLTNLDSELRDWQISTATEQGFKELANLNKETTLAKQLADALGQKELRQLANNSVSLTDYIIAAEALSNPAALAGLGLKRVIGKPSFQAAIARKISPKATKAELVDVTDDIFRRQRVKLQQEASQAQREGNLKRLQEIQEQTISFLRKYKPGDKESISKIKKAIKEAQELSPSQKNLLEGELVLSQPQPVLSKSSNATVSKVDDLVKKGVIKADEKKLAEEALKFDNVEEFVRSQKPKIGIEVRDKTGAKLQNPYTAEYLPTNPDGTITIYHSTTKSSAKKIKQDGIFGSKVEDGNIYFTTNKKGYGGIGKGKDEVLTFNIKPDKIQFDDVYRGELHLKGNNIDIGGIKPTTIKTKSQLTDLYNKVHGKK